MLFAEYDRSSSIKNFTDRLNLCCEWQVDNISAKFTAESTKKLYESGKSGFGQMFFSVFSENWEGVSKIFQIPITHVFCCILCDNSVLLHLKGLFNHQLKNNQEFLHEYYEIIKEQQNLKTIEAVEDYKTGETYLPH